MLSQSFIEPPVEDIAEVVGLFSNVEIIVKHEQQIGRDNKCGVISENADDEYLKSGENLRI